MASNEKNAEKCHLVLCVSEITRSKKKWTLNFHTYFKKVYMSEHWASGVTNCPFDPSIYIQNILCIYLLRWRIVRCFQHGSHIVRMMGMTFMPKMWDVYVMLMQMLNIKSKTKELDIFLSGSWMSSETCSGNKVISVAMSGGGGDPLLIALTDTLQLLSFNLKVSLNNNFFSTHSLACYCTLHEYDRILVHTT